MNANNERLINEPCTSSSYNDFFDFGVVIKQEAEDYSFKASEQVLHFFLEKGTGFNILQQYTEVKKVFLKYNTPLSSWTLAEKLFPYATMANSPNCNRFSDSLFQKRVILKANWKHWNEK